MVEPVAINPQMSVTTASAERSVNGSNEVTVWLCLSASSGCGLVVSEAKRFEARLGRDRLRKLKIRRIQPVEKQKGGQPPDKFQIGTRVAHILCSRGIKVVQEPSGPIKICDMSDTIRRTVQQFDGKPFFED